MAGRIEWHGSGVSVNTGVYEGKERCVTEEGAQKG